MNRIISLLLVFVCLFTLASCGPNVDPTLGLQGVGTPQGNQNQYEVIYNRPAGVYTPAPEALRLEWDIKSVRNLYDEAADVENGDYSMPVYKFDTYAEYSHLRDILGEEHMPTIDPIVNDQAYVVIYNDYRSGTFEEYSLLLGWFTVETCHSEECYIFPEIYDIEGNNLLLYVQKRDCECTEDDSHQISGMIWASVPKEELENIEGISFVLEKCFSTNE